MADDLWRLSGMELSLLLAKGELSPVELLDQVLDRCKQLNPRYNAIVLIDEKSARHAAKASEKRFRDGCPLGLLDGLPITVKDNIHVAGWRTTWGSPLFESFLPDKDDLSVERLRKAGAVIVGKTNTPEFAMMPVTENRIFGVTRNPWQTDLTPGGSSGGAVASIAAGLVPLAIGTDAGGSIRRPASYAGVVGFKPSIGRVPRLYGFPPLAADFQVIGPMARTVGDVKAIFACIEGPHPLDRLSLAVSSPTEWRNGNGARILYVPRAGTGPIDPEVTESVKGAAEALEELGCSMEEGAAPYDVEEINAIWSVIVAVGVKRVLDSVEDWQGRVDPMFTDMAERAEKISAATYLKTLDRVAALRQSFAASMSDVDAILMPSSAALPWPVGDRYPSQIDGQDATPQDAAVFATVVNICGHPAINLPSSPSRSGLPIGFQLIGGFGADGQILELAEAYESARPWHDRWPTIPAEQPPVV